MTDYVNRLGVDALRTAPLPEGATAAVWSLDTGLDAVGGHPVAEAERVLDAAELKQAGQKYRPADRHRYTASHIGLRVLLGAHLGLAPADVVLVREDCPGCAGPHGRPAVAGGGVHFSLSHSGDLAYVALAPVPVGVDIEELPSDRAVADVLGNLHPAETAELTALPQAGRRAALARVWSRKEACLKGIGTGIGLGIVEPYVGSGPDPAAVPGWLLTDLPAPADYAAALAVRV
ncbi:4'-phosphopantetheinyl transferase superfamily protein [Streptomyces sp. NPDC091371]|uniref:4'-phosphopantetheinyl transferase family protein n=1 Tax=Streptomyces sp. NPDC091371 TaxID=3155303 RepID=UPI0034427315